MRFAEGKAVWVETKEKSHGKEEAVPGEGKSGFVGKHKRSKKGKEERRKEG